MAVAKNRRMRRAIATGMVGAGLIGVLSGCSTQEVNGSSDEVTCIYNNETGALDGDVMLPGANQRDVDSEYKTIRIPTSDRFWNISPTPSRDAAAPQSLVARDASYKETHTSIEVKFRFNADLACKWYDQHGRRDTGETGGDMLFNKTGDPNTPWQKYLNRVFTEAERTINENLVRRYSWEYLEFNFPVNADKNGVVPEGTDPALQTLRQIEQDFSVALSAELKTTLGDDYFCGINYDVGGDKCTSLQVKVSSVRLADQKPVEDRKGLIADAEAAAIAKERAELTKSGTEAAVEARQAEADKQRQIAAIDAQAAIDKANQDKAVADAQKATEVSDAAKKVAVCLQAGVAGADCAELVSVTNGGGLRPTTNGVTVTPGS